MKLEQRLGRLESGVGGQVSIGDWCDGSGRPFEPDAELRCNVERQAYSLQPDYTEWRLAVRIPDELVDAIIVLLGDGGRIQLIEISPYTSQY